MKPRHYTDTSFLCSLYRKQVHTPMAIAYREAMDEPLFYTSLLEFEFLQSIELQVWLHSQDRTKGYHRAEAVRMIADWEADAASGVNVLVPFDMSAVLRLARSLSGRHTATGGHRTLDVLYVATAVHLGAGTFLTFDARQRDLAHHADLDVPRELRLADA